jgi:ribulose-phosphate 3-epimerase
MAHARIEIAPSILASNFSKLGDEVREVEEFVRAGANRVLVHQEATPHLDRALAMIRESGAEAGAAINPATPVSMLTEVLDKVDTVLVMSVNPGFGGQKFIPGALEKIRQLNQWRVRYNAAFRIEVDGGVEAENVAELAQVGANTFVAGTSIFHTPDPAAAVRRLRKLALEAVSQKV